MFVTRTTRNPSDSMTCMRYSSRANSSDAECVTPSTSTTSLPSSITKSTTYRSIGCCRRNFQCASFRFLNACHSRAFALVCEARSLRALCLKRCMPTTSHQAEQISLPPRPLVGPLTRPLRGRPLPNGERCSASHVEGARDLHRVGLSGDAQIPRRRLDLGVAEQQADRLDIAGAVEDVERLRPPQRFVAVLPGIEPRLGNPEFQQAV